MSTDEKTQDGPLRFELTLEEIPFELYNKKTKEVTKFVIVELPGDKRDEHMEALRKNMEFDPNDGKIKSIKTFKGINSALLAQSIYRANPDGTPGELVPESEILSWPGRTLDHLNKLATTLSGLDKEEEEEKKSKNDSSASGESGSISPQG